jgi:hypothetical protein
MHYLFAIFYSIYGLDFIAHSHLQRWSCDRWKLKINHYSDNLSAKFLIGEAEYYTSFIILTVDISY